ncbi:disabled homolog 2-interacting protein-like isoform X2 [Macrobrachium rosenbergii]|uniref:disabled homolog 2-interacting protein-like isoform X2 n=2 Tax=Macrobrachium rosenbergii TaxID=79674 RepID=UPI0034D74A9A
MEGETAKKIKQRRYSLQTQREWRSFRRCLYNFSDDTGVLGATQQKHEHGSAPSSPAVTRSAESTPSKFSFFNKLSKKKSSSKKTPKVEEGEAENDNESPQLSRSQESIQYASAGYVEVTPPSDSPRSRVRAHSGESPYSSPYHERSRIHGISEDGRRRENTLKIWIMEVKGVPSKKRYFCNLLLGNEPYRRTFSKTMSRMCFWGEYFELESIPQFCSFRVDLLREGDKRPGHKKIGSVEIDLPSVSSCPTKLVDEWYAVKVDNKQDREIPTLRIKHRFQSLDILPLHRYNSLRLHLRDNATTLCSILEPLLCVKAKEDIANALINIMQAENLAIPFLVSLILADIQRMADNEHLLLRGNSIATKAIEAYMRLVGEYYLQETLSEPIQALIAATEELEVDPLRITNMASLPDHREALKTWVSRVWERITQSSHKFPLELRRIFHSLRMHLSTQEKDEVTDKLVSACVFLRFICPAILYPSLFNITQEYPDEGTVRNLTLVAKTLQTLANFTSFRGKENFMEFLSDFIDREQEQCRNFLGIISSLHCENERTMEFGGQIDIGRQCALLHLHLTDALAQMDGPVNQNEASQVVALVEGVNSYLGTDRKRKQPITCQISSHAATSLQLSNQSYLHVSSRVNNNYIDDQSDAFMEHPYENDLEEPNLSILRGATRKSSYSPSGGPLYHRPKNRGTKSLGYFSREKTAATDLSTNDDYVFVDAINQHSGSPGFPNPMMETSNNNEINTNDDWPNGNHYYVEEMPRPDSRLHGRGSPGPRLSPVPHPRYSHNSNHGRLYPRATGYHPRSHSVSGVPSPLERRRLHPDLNMEVYSPLDACSQQISALMVDPDNIQGSQTSISQISNVASSGYQSFVYSQSSSPVDSLLQADNMTYVHRENRSLTPPVINHGIQESPLASPHHQLSTPTKRHRPTNKHSSHLRYGGYASVHGTPRHTARLQKTKENQPGTGLGSSHSVEDLPTFSSARRRNCSSSSDESTIDSPPPSLCGKTRLHYGGGAPLPRTNPLCSSRINNQGDFHQEDFDDEKRLTREPWGQEEKQTDPEEPQTLTHLSSYQILGQQEKQMRAIVDKLTSMEQEFRHEQSMMWHEIQRKEARIDDQAKKIAELDNANTELSRTVAKLNNNL